MFLSDAATTIAREKTREGFLRVRARIGRTGIHSYKAREIGSPPGFAPDDTIRVHRPPGEVFEPASMASFAGVPVTLDHPPAMVDSANWKEFAVGHSGPDVRREGDHLATDLLITDAGAIGRAEAGAELSNGYFADFDFSPGRTSGGEAFDAVQRNIRGNHIAVVDHGRCGPTCRIDAAAAGGGATTGDCAPAHAAATLMTEAITIVVDGVAIDTHPEGAAAIARLEAALAEARAARRPAVEVRDAGAGSTGTPDPAVLDALLEERAAVLDTARRVLGPNFDGRGQTTVAIRRAAVAKVLGTERVRDRNDDYVSAAFDTIAASRGPNNPLAAHLAASGAAGSTRESALAARNRHLATAWAGETA